MRTATGTWDTDEKVFTASSPLVTFELTGAQTMTRGSCYSLGATLHTTQFPHIYLSWGSSPLNIETIAEEVNLALEDRVLEDRVARLEQRVTYTAEETLSTASLMPSWWTTVSTLWAASAVFGQLGGLLALTIIAIQVMRCMYAFILSRVHRSL